MVPVDPWLQYTEKVRGLVSLLIIKNMAHNLCFPLPQPISDAPGKAGSVDTK